MSALCPQLPVVGVDITIQIPGIVRDLYVDRGKTVLIPAGIAAWFHLSLPRERLLSPA